MANKKWTVSDKIVLRVCEIPDRDSPDDQPEMMLVTPKELKSIVDSVLEDETESQASEVTTLRALLTEIVNCPHGLESRGWIPLGKKAFSDENGWAKNIEGRWITVSTEEAMAIEREAK